MDGAGLGVRAARAGEEQRRGRGIRCAWKVLFPLMNLRANKSLPGCSCGACDPPNPALSAIALPPNLLKAQPVARGVNGGSGLGWGSLRDVAAGPWVQGAPAALSMMRHSRWCQALRGSKLSMVPNFPLLELSIACHVKFPIAQRSLQHEAVTGVMLPVWAPALLPVVP